MTDRTYLTPDELDFASDDSVRELGDGRYVVAVGGDAGGGDANGGNRRRTERERRVAPENGATDGETTAGAKIEGETRDGESAEPKATDGGTTDGTPETSEAGRYYLELGARTDVAEDETVVEGDDIRAVFADALRWYARRVAPSEDPATVVEVLLDETEFAVTDRVPDR
ncbi:DUF7500 family protein [Halopelagius longus]|uniref:Uncharacterized protein n=1 Tax=Halopelagius longus TaxID=1236180 RepID=A0A1H1BGD1_9EURY|nr:hypothetical protein [Halopelagius longus]RDI70777.1 hypothetical protein DWB78_02980 [Halopelagius longus]SDQ50957.1 hypothetical protein SAMN05216278_1783 [Halopelagius longus]